MSCPPESLFGEGRAPLPLPQDLIVPAIRPAVERALAARARLVAEYPQWDTWRQQVHAAKSEVIGRLDDYLDSLQNQVESWGGQVWRAANVQEVAAILARLCQRHRVSLVVKAKSMTGEEAEVNAILTRLGCRVLETDLGEFIIQLAGDRPAHLTNPAMHLSRYQIATLFRNCLGTALPPDPQVLSRAGAAYLRPFFWQAELGLTGINFASAADGYLICLENEGNLGLCATVPPVQVALMGLEKLLPDLAALEPILRLLPASATGQRLTAYVHFFWGRKPLPQGWQDFHLILLDNGRRRLAAEPVLRQALYCLRCGACQNICPIFQIGGSHLYNQVYAGPVGIILSAFLGAPADLTDFCSSCGACSDICPAAIPLAELILYLRRRSRKHPYLRVLIQTATLILSHPRLYRLLQPLFRQAAAKLPERFAVTWWGPLRRFPRPSCSADTPPCPPSRQ